MPSRTAVRLCPHAVFLPSRIDYYAEVSAQIHEILKRFTPDIEPLALDEAFLDVTASHRLLGDGATIAARLRAEIRAELGLTASVGVAPNKFVAKIASDLDKPDGLVVVAAGGVGAFLDPLPVRRIWGIGKVAEGRLAALGVATVAELKALGGERLRQVLGDQAGRILALARGEDERPVVRDRETRSVSQETTFASDVGDAAVLIAVARDQTAQVAWRLRRHGLRARTVQVKLRNPEFVTRTRASTLADATDVTADLWSAARRLLERELGAGFVPLRLLGVGASEIHESDPGQLDLFDGAHERQRRLDTVSDRINERFGKGRIRRGATPRSH
jgi:DNA polymerase-4